MKSVLVIQSISNRQPRSYLIELFYIQCLTFKMCSSTDFSELQHLP